MMKLETPMGTLEWDAGELRDDTPVRWTTKGGRLLEVPLGSVIAHTHGAVLEYLPEPT